ncbi:hypothetical protein AAF712_001145 [Marasmius tenuissimus]|uniref:Uncharacterized protein n=1 Tax=Marasmius tenuissimus TaxID=585030 RepID=A0ABR3AFI9_9AGAR|nr:hypothetical protein PM082_003124 [Marasmius tenuissimus]
MTKGTKRASPGADDEKSPLASVELSDEDAKKLDDVRKDIQRAELILEREAQKKLIPVYEKRRQVVKTIPKFWPIALLNHSLFAIHAQHTADQLALAYLEDLWIDRDPNELRCYTIEFHFKENPHFHDKVLKKEYKYVPALAAAGEQADADGLTESMLDFSWERDVEPSVTKINWKDADKALTKLYPRKVSDDDDEDLDEPTDAGSFFNYFEEKSDPLEVGLNIANEIFPEAIDYFLGTAGGDDLDSEDEEDDDDEAEEIDLEKPKTKKQKV